MDIAADPKDPKTIYIGTHEAGVLKSTDGGKTWREAGSGLGGSDIHGLAIDPNKPCKRNVDCPKRIDGFNPIEITCNLETGKCQECVSNADCVAIDGGPGVCDNGHCTMND